MSKGKSIKNLIIVILCTTIIAMGIGYMFLSMKLEEYRQEKDTFVVYFKSAHLLSSIKGGDKDPSGKIDIDSSGKILKMDFQLYDVHDEINYEVTIKNEGTLEAKIVNLFLNPDFRSKQVMKDISPVVISISDVSGKILEPGEEATIKISAIYDANGHTDIQKKAQSIKGKIGLISESNIES